MADDWRLVIAQVILSPLLKTENDYSTNGARLLNFQTPPPPSFNFKNHKP